MEMTRSHTGQLWEKLPDDGDVLLDERIEAELHGLRPPADLDDLAGGAHGSNAIWSVAETPGRVDRHIDTETIALLRNIFDDAAIECDIGADFARGFEAFLVARQSGDNDLTGTAELRHLRA